MLPTSQVNPFSRGIDLSRSLFGQALSSIEELAGLGLDHTQELVGRNTRQLKDVLADPPVAVGGAQWPDSVQQSLHLTINLFRDTALAAADYQIDSLRLLHNQATEAQKSIAAAIYEQFEDVDQAVAGSGKRTGKSPSTEKAGA